MALQGHEGPVLLTLKNPHLGEHVERRVERVREHVGSRVHVHVEVDLVDHVEVLNATGDRVLAIGEVETYVTLLPLRVPVFPSASGDGLEPSRVIAAHGVVDHHQSPTASEEDLQVVSLRTANRRPFRRVEHEYVSLCQDARAGKLHARRHARPPLPQEISPFREEPRVIVLPGSMGLHSRPNVNTQGLPLTTLNDRTAQKNEHQGDAGADRGPTPQPYGDAGDGHGPNILRTPAATRESADATPEERRQRALSAR